MPILDDIIDTSRFLDLTDDDLTRITSELQQDPYAAFRLESNFTLQQIGFLTLRYVKFFDPKQYSAATPEQKTKLEQVSLVINTSRDALIIQKINEAFLEAIHFNDRNQIKEMWENCANKLDEKSQIAFVGYAKANEDDALQTLLASKFTNSINSENFAKNRGILIGKALINLNKYNPPYIKRYLEALLTEKEEKYQLVSIAVLKRYFNGETLEKLLAWQYVVEKTDWIFVVAQAIKENNYQAIVMLTNQCKAVGILGNTVTESDNFLAEVVKFYKSEVAEYSNGQEIYKSRFAKYSDEQRSVILKFFARSNNPHFSMLLEQFKELPTKDILAVMQNCLESDFKKNIEEKFEWHASMTGNTLLHLFVSLIPSGHEEYLCQVLNDYKKYINKANKLGETPLNIACQIHKNNSELSIVKKLLELGADPNVFDNEGNSPLIIAVVNGNIKLIELLVAKKAIPHKFNRFGESAISFIDKCQNEILKDKMKNILLKPTNFPKFVKNKPGFKPTKTKSWPTTGIFPKDILRNDLGRVISQGKGPQFLSMIHDNYILLTNNLSIIEEILPEIIDSENIVMLNAVLEKFKDRDILIKDSEFIKKLFCRAIKKDNLEIVRLLLNYVTKEYCQQEDVKQLIAAKNNPSLTKVMDNYVSPEPMEIFQLNPSIARKRKHSSKEEEKSENESKQSEEEDSLVTRGYGLC